MLEAIGMLVLHVALDALGTQLAEIEREVLPGLPPYDFVVAHAQLYAALLSAETAVGLDHLVFFLGRDPPARGHAVERRTELPDDFRNLGGELCHRSKSCEALCFGFRRTPKCILDKGQVLATALWANILVMPAVLHLILDTERRLHGLQIADLQLPREGLTAANALCRSALFAGTFIEIDTHLCRALEDVEELAEGQIQQREYNRYGMEL